MEARHSIGLIAVYIFLYYAIARSALTDIRRLKPELYPKPEASIGVELRDSIDMVKMLFDGSLPRELPRVFQVKLYLARAMLLSPLLFIGVFTVL